MKIILFHLLAFFDKISKFCSFTLDIIIQDILIHMDLPLQQSQPKIRPFLLWDVTREGFDFSKNKQLVIERTCSLGNFSDFKEIVRFYGFDTIKKELIKSASLDRKSLSFFSLFFDIPLENFKCYSKNPLHLQH